MAETIQPSPEEITNGLTPHHRNDPETSIATDPDPFQPSKNLEREEDYSKEATINELVNQVLSGQFEMAMRNKRYRELFGKDIFPGINLKAWFAGEGRAVRDNEGRVTLRGGDFQIVHGGNMPYENTNIETRTRDTNGNVVIQNTEDSPDTRDSLYLARVEYNRRNEILRRAVGVGWRITRQVGISAAIGTLTGGVGAACYWAAGGAAAGEGIVEGMRVASQEEISMRERMEVARVRYFKKARELASRIGPAYSEEVAEGKTENDYNTRRVAAIRSLVDFIHSYEQLSVDVEYDEDGNPYVMTEVRGEPMPQRIGPESLNDPMQGINRGEAYNYGTELRQESKHSPDAVLVKDLEDQLAEARKKWDRRRMIGGMIGGLAAIGAGFIRNNAEWIQNAYNSFQTKLQNGEVVKLDIDGDWKRHGVQMFEDKLGKMQDRFVYHMRGVGEQLEHLRSGAEVLDPITGKAVKEVAGATIDKFGVHTLGETVSRINQAVYNEAVKDVVIKMAQNASAIGLNYLWERLSRNAYEKAEMKHRGILVHNQEQKRRDLQPDTVMDILKKRAETEHKVMPEVGQVWQQMLDDGSFHRIKILQILENGDAIVQHDDKGKQLNMDNKIPLQDIMDNYDNLTFREKPERVYPQREGAVSSPEPSNPSTPNAPEQKADKSEDKEKTEEEKKKEMKVKIKTEKEAEKEIILNNGQIFSEKNKKGLIFYFEMLVNDDGSVVKKDFKLKPDGSPEYRSADSGRKFANISEFQGWLNGRNIKLESSSMKEFTESQQKKTP